MNNTTTAVNEKNYRPFEFHAVFEITRKIVFEVSYFTLGNNENPYFTTQAAIFNQPKTIYKRSGQAQENVLPKDSLAYIFYKKWDKKHLLKLTNEEHLEMILDLMDLMLKYNSLIRTDTSKNWTDNFRNSGYSFYQIKKLSMIELPKKNEMAHNYEGKL